MTDDKYVNVPVRLELRELEPGEEAAAIVFAKPRLLRWDAAIVALLFPWLLGPARS